MTPKAAKAKGRLFQQYTRDRLLDYAPDLEPDDIRSTSMGASGEDILLSPAARKVYPYSFECKHVERLNIWDAIKQCISNAKNYMPAVVFRRNFHEPYIAIPFTHFMELISENRKLKEKSE